LRVLVTGGAGYIGSHAARQLARGGHQVRVFDNLANGYRFLCRDFDFVQGDLRDAKSVAPAVAGMDAVMHFGALASVAESVEHPRRYFQNNVEGTLQLLDAVLDAGIQKFIFSSTAAVYGNPEVVPIREDSPRVPINPYGVSKLLIENALEAYSRAYGLRFIAFRYFNAAGADASGEIGEVHDPETHLIPSLLLAAAGARPEVNIFGDDYPTPDGTCIRDYIHVSDLVFAHIRGLDYLDASGESTPMNLGTEKGFSVREVLAATEKITGITLRKKIVSRRPGDPAVLLADPTRAQRLLQWAPTRSLEEMIESAWKWLQNYRSQPENFKQMPGRAALQ
jgi:UDP-glucose 4-epimerase